MINEDITQRECNLAVRVGSIAYSELKKALEKLLTDLEQGKNNILGKSDKAHATDKKPELKHGKQTLKDLQKHNEGLSTIELKDPNLRELYKSMKKDGVDFAPVKDGKGQYTLFFKAKDADTLTHALKNYTQKLVKLDKTKPSIKTELTEAKKKAQTLDAGRDKVKDISKGVRDR